MTSSMLLSVTTFIYGLAAVCYIAGWIFRRPLAARLGIWSVWVAVVGNGVGFTLRWMESYQMGIGHAPLSNLYESLVFFAWTIGISHLVIEYRYHNRVIGAFTLPLAFLAMAYASLSPHISDRIQPLIPALKSNWLIAHVITCFIGYAAFAVGFGLSIMYLLNKLAAAADGESTEQRPADLLVLQLFLVGLGLILFRFILGWSFGVGLGAALLLAGLVDLGGWLLGRHQRVRTELFSRFPEPSLMDLLTHQTVMFGFVFLSAGIITGSIWANSAWGRYWGWDPKETWSLITWFVYATLLHARLMRGWQGRRIAYLSILGFVAVLFTYFGVNLLPGLHSYGAMTEQLR
ncbi:MAG: c-type cytochrome biogenesis protein CcsB [Desulfobacterales bacterium]|jgi:cytochrome c-type biogenesis protein CcsB|nr:c-type cytochrome biogenesis protein CcsB [Desulfobacteraceae bacterium]MDY0312516.1 c-type cytochrome biogenesis protein CcsB [Desulfobacterales bacterium]